MNPKIDTRGAVYVPSRAFNAYQMWKSYDSEECDRDMGFAASVNLNALRLWLSYEYWLEAPRELERKFDDLLSRAESRGIRIMPSLFEICGVEPEPENLSTTDLFKAFAISSPGRGIMENPGEWKRPLEYVDSFMQSFAKDRRILAIEAINEPHELAQLRFAREVFKTIAKRRGSVPLTVGSIRMEFNMYFMDLGLDILQTHLNFPQTLAEFESSVEKAVLASRTLDRPVWVTEWQRLRPSGSGWENTVVGKEEWEPALAPLAAILRKHEIGNFFWSLMVKAAYLPPQRPKGTLNGMFHEDGAVWSLEDARAVSGNGAFTATERKEWPDWLQEIPKRAGIL